jgi:RimJ/RimL family protein N-acetyltransferase
VSTTSPKQIRLRSGSIVIIRNPTVDDAHGFVEIMRSVAREGEYTLAEPDEVDWTDQAKRQDIQASLSNPGYLDLVADVDGKIVGFLEFENGHRRRTRHSGMFSIFIRKGWREQGIGTALIGTLLDWATDSPIIEKVTLAVFSTNVRAFAVYQKMGFHVEGRCPRDMKVGDEYIDSILMYKFVKPVTT